MYNGITKNNEFLKFELNGNTDFETKEAVGVACISVISTTNSLKTETEVNTAIISRKKSIPENFKVNHNSKLSSSNNY